MLAENHILCYLHSVINKGAFMNTVDLNPVARFRENTVTGADANRQARITLSLTRVWNKSMSPREASPRPKHSPVVTIGTLRRTSEKSARRQSKSDMRLDASGGQHDSPLGSPTLGRAKEKIRVLGTRIIKGKTRVKDVFSNIFPKRQVLQLVDSSPRTNFDEGNRSPKVSALSLEDITSSIEQTKKRISSAYDKLATSITKYTLSVEEKKKRIATYIGAVSVIIKALVCHGDLKPENILWDDDSFVINDFSGSISIEEMVELINPEFIFENEEEKKAVRDIVLQLSKANPINVQTNIGSIEKLVMWDILKTSCLDQESCYQNAIYDEKKFNLLKDYLATQFLPDGTEGYGSKLYRIAMCNYFWRAEKENFKNACQALDMRAAALTIYAILTATHPPKDENDKDFYISLERKLLTLGLSAKACSIIRRMAEPCLAPLGMNFTPPVTLDELEDLQNEFNPQNPQVDPQKREEMNEERKRLELLQASLKRLSLSKGFDDEVPNPNIQIKDEKQIQEEFKEEERKIRVAMQNLLDAISENDSSEDEQIHHKLRITLIDGALKRYQSNACEADIQYGDQRYHTVLLLDVSKPEDCDVLLRKDIIGSGGSVTAYLALSLRTLKHVVIKYTQELADPQEANKADKRLKQIGDHEGIQERAKLFRLQLAEDYKQVVVEPFYKNRDFASCVFGDLFCSKWSIPKQRDVVRKVLGNIDSHIQEICLGTLDELEKFKSLELFIDEYGKTFTGILGLEESLQLFQEYRELILLTPKLQKAKQVADRVLRAGALAAYRLEAEGLVKGCLKRDDNLEEDLLDKKSLWSLLTSDRPSDLKCAIKEEAKTVMQRLIRRSQAKVLREFILESPNLKEDPVPVMKKWEKAANEPGFRDKHLSLSGINSISETLGMSIRIGEAIDSMLKEKLIKLCELYTDLNLNEVKV